MPPGGRILEGMKLRGLPLWLVCDVICWLGVMFTFTGFARHLHDAVARMLAEKRRSLEPTDFSFLATLLAGAEAWRVYACQRRAFRLAGLAASCVEFPAFTVPTRRSFSARVRANLRDTDTMDALARRMAQRILQLLPRDALGREASRPSSSPGVDPTVIQAVDARRARSDERRTCLHHPKRAADGARPPGRATGCAFLRPGTLAFARGPPRQPVDQPTRPRLAALLPRSRAGVRQAATQLPWKPAGARRGSSSIAAGSPAMSCA